jgi:polypeptide N-acetylgalactosaminyltransferase
LLARIKEKNTAVLIPTIDNIDDKTMYYSGGGSGGYGIFTWSMFFTWGSIPERVRKTMKSHISPYPSPVMPGGLFAIDRKYFFDTGAYDDEMVCFE